MCISVGDLNQSWQQNRRQT